MRSGRLALVVLLGAAMVVLAVVTSRYLTRVLGEPAQIEVEEQERVVAPTPSPDAAGPKIRAKLFFVSDDGAQLVAVEREVALGEGVVAQARALVEAQLAEPAPEPLAAAVPAGTRVRGVFQAANNHVFIDLDGTVQKAHPGGSLNETLTIYTIVNAVTVNLPTVEQVQVLIDGREVDTLAGHLDLRRPLRKDESLIQP